MNKFRPIKAGAAFHWHRYGITLIWTVFFLLLFVLLVGLTINTAKIYLVSHQLQNAADAAALAGARWVKVDVNEARGQAVTIAALNRADGNSVVLNWNTSNDPEGDIVIGRFDPNTNPDFIPTMDPNSNALKVVAQRSNDPNGGHNDPVPLIFNPIASVTTANIARFAIAVVSGGTGDGLLSLAPNCADGPGLRIHGNPTLDVNDGAIQVNANCNCAVDISGNKVHLSAEELNIVGGDCLSGFSYPPGFTVNEGVPPIPDPLCPLGPGSSSCLPAPTIGSPATPNEITASGTYGRTDGGINYYPGGIDIKSTTSVTLTPGIYVLGGAGLQVNGKASLNAQGVMFYIINPGSVKINGTGTVIITPMKSGVYEGIAIFQARNNFNDATINGTGTSSNLDGTLYFPGNGVDDGPLVTLIGNGNGQRFGAQFIAWRVQVGGDGVMIVNYDGRNPAPGNRSYLVK